MSSTGDAKKNLFSASIQNWPWPEGSSRVPCLQWCPGCCCLGAIPASKLAELSYRTSRFWIQDLPLTELENSELFGKIRTFSRPFFHISQQALVLQLRCAPVLGEPCSNWDVLRFSNLGVLRFLENHALVLGELCTGSRRTVLQLRCAPVLQIFGLCVWSRKYLCLYAGSQGRILWESAASQ